MRYLSQISLAACAALWLPSAVAAQSAAPTQDDTNLVLTATEAFLFARATGNHADAYAMYGRGLQDLQNATDAAAVWDEERARGIPFADIQIVNVTWYTDPAGLAPGAYAAIDFRGASPEVPIVCGFMVWHNVSPVPRINRVEMNVIDADIYAQMDDATRASFETQFGCR